MSHVPPALDPATRRRLVALVRRAGERRAIALLDTSRQTLTRALSGLGIRPATAIVLRMRLDALALDEVGGD